MAVPANSIQTFAAVGIREELSDIITLMQTDEFPFFTMVKKGKTQSRTPEWQIDSFRAANAANGAVEGDVVVNDARTQPTRVKNIVQLFDEVIEVSSSMAAVNAAGRNPDEMQRQVGKAMTELKSDVELRACGNYASVLGTASTAGLFGGGLAWLTTNVSRGATGANGGFSAGIVAAATNGTLRTFTEALLKSALATAYTNGGRPTLIILDVLCKQTFSGFAGNATKTLYVPDTKDSAVTLGAVDIYVSDVGKHRAAPSRFTTARDAFCIDPEGWEFLFLQPFSDTPLAKVGHSDRRLLAGELTLRCWNEKKNAVVADIQP